MEDNSIQQFYSRVKKTANIKNGKIALIIIPIITTILYVLFFVIDDSEIKYIFLLFSVPLTILYPVILTNIYLYGFASVNKENIIAITDAKIIKMKLATYWQHNIGKGTGSIHYGVHIWILINNKNKKLLLPFKRDNIIIGIQANDMKKRREIKEIFNVNSLISCTFNEYNNVIYKSSDNLENRIRKIVY